MALLSPILARWGLRLEFDEAQPAGERVIGTGASALPVQLAGAFTAVTGGRPDARCAIEHEGLIAQCRVGRGRVIAVADAALLEPGRSSGDEAQRMQRLESLVARGLD